MTKYNHDGKMSHDVAGVTEEEFYTISEKASKELDSMVSAGFKISEIAEAIETWLATGTDTERTIKYLHVGRAVTIAGMV